MQLIVDAAGRLHRIEKEPAGAGEAPYLLGFASVLMTALLVLAAVMS